jgi:CDP-glycerol glycerophosphotransferase (TagB/SpsB family)
VRWRSAARRVARKARDESVRAAWRARPAPLLSVIVPVYDVEKYLEACVTSLRRQLHHRVEIILVDDGSTDGSLALARRLAADDSRITVLTQANAGQSVARHHGLDHAKGEYVTFVDSDDTVTRDGLARAVRSLERTGSDYALMPYQRLRAKGVVEPTPWIDAIRRNPRERASVADPANHDLLVHNTAHSKLFRRSFWDVAGLHFPAGVILEDQMLSAQAAVHATAIDAVPTVAYNYRVRGGSTMSTLDGALMKAFFHAIETSQEILSAVPGAAEARLVQVLSNDMPRYVRAAIAVRDEAYLDTLLERLPPMLERVDPAQLQASAPNFARVAYEHVRAGRRAELEHFLTHDGLVLNHHDGSLEPVGPVSHLPGWDDPSMPREAFVLTERQTPLDTMVMRARWTPSDVLSLTLRAGLRHLDSHDEDPVGRAWLVGARGTRMALPIRLADERFGHHHVSWRETFDRSTWVVDVDPAEVVRALGREASSARLEVEVSIAGRTRTGTVGAVDRESSAAALRPRRVAGRTWVLATKGGLRVTASRSARVPEPPAGVVVDAIEIGAHAITVRGSGLDAAATIDLVSGRLRQHARTLTADAEGFVATFDVTADPWGFGPTALPLGDYALEVLTSDTTVAHHPSERLVASVPHDQHAGDLAGQLHLRADGTVGLRVVKPRAIEHQRMYGQRALREAYRAADVTVDPDVALFQCYWAEVATDSPRAIHDELRRRRPDMKLYWGVVDHSVALPEGAIPLVAGTPEWYDVLATAKYVVKNTEVGAYTRWRPGQVHVQTFHGQPFKKMGAAYWRDVKRAPEFVVRYECAERRSDHWTVILTAGPDSEPHYRDNYFYDGPIHDRGLPRTDGLVGERAAAARERTREKLGIRPDQTAVLHATTWRDDQSAGNNTSRDVRLIDLAGLAESLGPDYVILQRSHGSVARTDLRYGDRPGVIDVTDHPEINDLILAADAALLDYSSLRFDFAVTGKPMIFLVPDLDRYEGSLRGFLFDYRETAPGPLVTDADEVRRALLDLDAVRAEHADDYATFNARFNAHHDGHAAERVVDLMLDDPRFA